MEEAETIAIAFTFASFDGLSTAFADFLYCNLKITRKVLITKRLLLMVI